MSSFSKYLFVSTAILALGACSSSGGGTVQPTLDPAGDVAPPRNLQLLDLSYLHPSSGDGVDETYDVASVAATFTVQANGANVLNTLDREDFSAGSTMVYDASANTFSFDVTTGSASLQETFGLMLLTNPVDLGSFEPVVVWIASNPARFGLPAALLGDPNAVVTFLDGLAADQREPIDLLVAALQDNTDFISYSSNGTTYSQLKLENSATQTYYTTLGLWETTNGSDRSVGTVVFGQHTPDFDIPRSGSVDYTGTMGGYLILQNSIQYLTGGANFTFDFTSSNVDFTLSAQLGDIGFEGGGVFFDYDTFTGSGRDQWHHFQR